MAQHLRPAKTLACSKFHPLLEQTAHEARMDNDVIAEWFPALPGILIASSIHNQTIVLR
jgi:hypothetical protein